jgi:acyl transferase domain-containing protein
MLSPDGRCKTFDATADGFVRGEGCGSLMLQREKPGRAALGRVRGLAVKQDGRSNGLTAPNGSAQVRLIKEALQVCSLSPGELQVLKAHGTGTSLGDPIEAWACERCARETRQGCFVGDGKRKDQFWTHGDSCGCSGDHQGAGVLAE